ncbi:hypothetical protein ACFZDG_26590 [Kitasatospora xanthocidica]|uniref:hypothetical protein n=1 Tax=Kitasatospora xanthocidica TaxID=83382 RepID=UPI0036EEF091
MGHDLALAVILTCEERHTTPNTPPVHADYQKVTLRREVARRPGINRLRRPRLAVPGPLRRLGQPRCRRVPLRPVGAFRSGLVAGSMGA